MQSVSSIKIVNPDSAGIDIGSSSHFVAIPSDREGDTVREFSCYTPDIRAMIEWLKKTKIKTVVMESTGSYWIPVFEMLDQAGFDVNLVDAHHVKNIRGKKSDVIDCQWLQQLHAHGLLAAAFRPKNEIIELRSYIRQRSSLIEAAAIYIQRIQKALVQMNIHLHNAISDITGGGHWVGHPQSDLKRRKKSGHTGTNEGSSLQTIYRGNSKLVAGQL